jgi:hypothetical protein
MCYRLPTLLVVHLLLLGGMAFGQDERPMKEAPAKNAWLYGTSEKQGSFLKGTGKEWTETTPEGGRLSFEEVRRTEQYVELFDRGRAMSLRLYADRAEWRQGDKATWNRLYVGRWADVSELPKPPARDYLIRLAYFVASDREPTPDYEKKIRVLMHFVSELYRQDFESRRIPSKGLRFETNDGSPIVHLIRGARPAAFYNNAPDYDAHMQWKRVIPEIPQKVGSPSKNLIIVFAETYDSGPAKFEWPGGVALGSRSSTEGGVGLFSAWILRPEFCATTIKQQAEMLFDPTPMNGRTAVGHGKMGSPRSQFIQDGFGAIAHELGHALGLPHDHRQDSLDIMGNGFRNLRWNFTGKPDPRRARFSDDNARVVYSSRYLAPDFVSGDYSPPTVQLNWIGPLKVGATQVNLSVTASDDEVLRAILFFSPSQDSVVGGRALKGKQQDFQQKLSVAPLRPGSFQIEALVTDVGGNLTRAELKGSVER